MRVSIARALVTEPQLLLMDEPFAALDEITRFKLNNDLLRMWQALRTTVVFVTHSVFESVYLSSRIVVMAARPGRVFTELAVDAPYPRDENFRTSAEYAALVPPRLGGAGAGHGGGRRAMSASRSATSERDDAATGCCASRCRSSCWRSARDLGSWWCGSRRSALCAAGARPDPADACRRLGVALAVASGHARPRPLRAFCSRPSAASASPSSSTSRGWSNIRSIPTP